MNCKSLKEGVLSKPPQWIYQRRVIGKCNSTMAEDKYFTVGDPIISGIAKLPYCKAHTFLQNKPIRNSDSEEDSVVANKK